jgi:hypothetical protein
VVVWVWPASIEREVRYVVGTFVLKKSVPSPDKPYQVLKPSPCRLKQGFVPKKPERETEEHF